MTTFKVYAYMNAITVIKIPKSQSYYKILSQGVNKVGDKGMLITHLHMNRRGCFTRLYVHGSKTCTLSNLRRAKSTTS